MVVVAVKCMDGGGRERGIRFGVYMEGRLMSNFERSETNPIGLSIPQGGKWAKAMLRLRSVPRDGAWYCIDPHGGRTTSEQTARKYNLALAIGSSSWQFAFREFPNATPKPYSELWVRYVGSDPQETR